MDETLRTKSKTRVLALVNPTLHKPTLPDVYLTDNTMNT